MICLTATWLPGPVAQGATFSWNQTGAGPFTWSTANNWTGSVAPANVAGDVINLTANLTAAQTINLDISALTGTLNIGDPTTAFFGYTLQSGTGSTLTFDNGAVAAALSKAAVATANDLISTDIILASTGSADFNITNAVANITSLLTLSGNISESGGAKNLVIAGNTPGSSNGVTVLAGNNSFTGTVSVNSGTLVAVGAASLNSGAANTITLASGTTLALRENGTGFGERQSIVFGDNLSISGSSTITLDRTGTAGFPGSTALNKTIQLNTLSWGAGSTTLTVTPSNGYGLEITGLTNINQASTTISVGTLTGSNVVQGLTLSGQVSGNQDWTKTGTGALVLTSAANDFTGNISVTGGILAFNSDAALGNAANTITLNGTTATLRATGTTPISSARSISFANATAANNVVEVVAGQTLTLTGVNAITNATGFVKADNGTLGISASQNFAGTTTINAGAVQLSSATGLGTSVISISPGAAVTGAALQLNNVSVGNTINLQGTNNLALGGINFGGQLQATAAFLAFFLATL